MVFIFAIATFVSTLLGGLFALKFRDKLHLILGFSAGAVVGVALFELAPESVELATKSFSISATTSLIAIGFIIFLVLDRLLSFHAHADEAQCENKKHHSYHGAVTLAIHSFLDGLGIGLAFKVSSSVGLVVALAVLAHDFSDGINTVNYILKNKGESKSAFRWLIVDAIAPVIGILSTFFFSVSESTLGLILAVFCGFFLYIGASDLIPESHHRHPQKLTTLMTVIGMLVILLATKLAG